MLFYLIGIQIYHQVAILRSWSKAKLHRAVLLGFGLKESKITLNIMKVGVHSYLPNAHLNIWSNFNFNKFVKSETSSCGFANIGVIGGENRSKCRESWSARLSIKWASKSMIKFQFWEIRQKWNFVIHFRYSWARRGPNRDHCKSWCACFYIKWASKSMIKFQLREFGQKWNSVIRFH